MKLQAIRMPYFYFDLVIGEEFKDQGGMILEDTDIAFDKADCLATPADVLLGGACLQRINGSTIRSPCRAESHW
jgi:hypothetical protein